MEKVVAQIESKELVQKRHDQIFKEALKLFSKKGYHRTTMRQIAKATGINLSYLYKYISSKDDILYLFYHRLHAMFEPIYDEVRSEPGANPANQLRTLLLKMLTTIHNNRAAVLTMYTESRHLEPDSLSAVLEKESEMVGVIEELILKGIETGDFKTKDPFMAANIIQFLLVIEALRGWNFKNRYSFEEFVELITEFIMNGLRAKNSK